VVPNYSIWLIPSSESNDLLGRLIKKTCSYFSCSIFSPHCTLIGGLKKPILGIIDLVDSCRKKSTELSCETNGLKIGEPPWKVFYIDLRSNSKIFDIQKYFSNRISSDIDYSFDPHLSLVYGRFNDKDLKGRIKNIHIPKMIKFDRIAIANTKGEIKDWSLVYETFIGEN